MFNNNSIILREHIIYKYNRILNIQVFIFVAERKALKRNNISISYKKLIIYINFPSFYQIKKMTTWS